MTVPLAAARLSPWSRVGRARLVLLVALGAGVVVGSWFFAGGRNDPGDQLVFVSLAVMGIVLEVSGVSGWIVEGRRSVRRFRRELLGGVTFTTDPAAAPVGILSSVELVARPDGRWIHRADCPMAKGRGWETVPSVDQPEGRRPCPACRP